MKMLITIEQLNSLRSRELVPLKCNFCENTFYLEQHFVIASINGKDKKRGTYCSKKCSGLDNSRRSRVIINCKQCNKEKFIRLSDKLENNFCSRKCCAIYYAESKRKPKIEKIKKDRKAKIINVNCSYCHIELTRPEYEFNQSKSKTFFCCKSHKTMYANQYQIIHKPKSRAETLLCNLIKENFPDLIFQENVRNVLSSKLEIDIFIPKYKLAIELNGPVHYIPIYGQEKLDKVKHKDFLKQSEINQLGLNLIVIDISQLNSRQSTDLFIREYFQKYIKPILESKEMVGQAA